MTSSNPALDSAHQFILRLAQDLRNGYRVVPYIGAGFSLAAGFPTSVVLSKHLLPYWIIRALGLNPLAAAGSGNREISAEAAVQPELRMWSPADGWWPEPGEEMLTPKVPHGPFCQSDALRLLSVLVPDENSKKPAKPDAAAKRIEEVELPASLDSLERAKQVIASEDWMMMLQLLSRLTRSTTEHPQVTSGPERQSVVDSLFLHLNKKCQPALSHEMLAALQHHWRCRVILTTNFDNLIEQAFAAAGEPLESFEVGKTSPLPDANLVLSQPSLVKMHGGRFDVRADVTVGTPLGREDIKNAMSYVAGRNLFRSDILQAPAAPDDKVALVFFGCGDSDERTASFAQYVRQHFPNRSKAYWISYTEKSVDKIKTLRLFPAHRKFSANYSDFGLLLLALYEHLNRTIPSNGTIFPGPWQLTTPPRIPSKDAQEVTKNLETARIELRKHLFEDVSKGRGENKEGGTAEETFGDGKKYVPKLGCNPLRIGLSESNYAGAAICLAFFERARDYNFTGLWIDIDEVTMPAGALIRVAMMIYRIEGVIDPLITLDTEGLNSDDRAKAFCETMVVILRRHYAETGVPVIAFFNASEEPGNDALFRLKAEEKEEKYARKNRWSGEEGRRETARMLAIVERLCTDRSCGFSAVFISPEKRPVTGDGGENCDFDKELKIKLECQLKWREIGFSESCTEFHPAKVTEIAVDWMRRSSGIAFSPPHTPRSDTEDAGGTSLQAIAEDEVRRIFLAAIIKFRHSRYPSSIARAVYTYFQEGMQFPDVVRRSISESAVHDKVDEWLEHLESRRVLRRRDGGFVWMNNRVESNLQDFFNTKGAAVDCLLLHGCIGRWYARLLFGCGDPLAAKEGISHHVRGVLWFIEKIEVLKEGGRFALSDVNIQELERADGMIRHARLLLSTSRILFERRVASTFSERTFLVLLEESRRLSDELEKTCKRCGSDADEAGADTTIVPPILSILTKSVGDLVRELTHARAVVALREGNYRSLLPYTSTVAAEFELRLCHAAARLHLRDYGVATSHFQTLWKELIASFATDVGDETAKLWAPPSGSVAFTRPPGILAGQIRRQLSVNERDETTTRRLVNLAGWGVYLHLNRSHAEWVARQSASNNSGSKEARSSRLLSLKCAEWFLQFGLGLLRTATDVKDGELFDENVILRAHGALLIAVLNTEHLSEMARADDAWRLHSDSESFFGGFPVADSGVTSAIVHLRAAEICLIEVMRHRPFGETRKIVRSLAVRSGSSVSWGLPKAAADILNQLDDNLSTFSEGLLQKSHCETLAVKVAECMNFLDKAERILVTHPKSRWWWWIFAVLKTKACEYLYVLRLARAVASNAGQGIEPRIVPPSAFLFLDSGLMKLVVEKDVQDAFYLARIISSLVEIYRCEIHYASLYATDNPRIKAYKRQNRSAVPLLTGRLRLIRHLQTNLKFLLETSSPDLCGNVRSYAASVQAKALELADPQANLAQAVPL